MKLLNSRVYELFNTPSNSPNFPALLVFLFTVMVGLVTVTVPAIAINQGADHTLKRTPPIEGSSMVPSKSGAEQEPADVDRQDTDNHPGDIRPKDPFDDSGGQQDFAIADPIEPFNRTMFWFNDYAFVYAIRPTARVYRGVLGRGARNRISNVFDYLDEPRNVIHSILQGRPADTGRSLYRLVVNGTVGIGGIFDPAGYHVKEVNRRADQTLAKIGLPPTMYIVWPLKGSSSLRETVAQAGDSYLYPPNYLESEDAGLAVAGIYSVRRINGVSYQLGDYRALKENSLDPYIALKNVYEQRLQKEKNE